MGEGLGSGSKCFQSTLTKGSSRCVSMTGMNDIYTCKCGRFLNSIRSCRSSTPACYPVVRCSQGSMFIKVAGKEVACPMAGGDVSVPGFQGTVRCPVGNKICQLLQTQCSGQGILMVDGSCSCNPGFGGSDCALKDCPLNSGVECNGRGTCDRRVGVCQCEAAYAGLSCSELLCPAVTNDKTLGEQCSGHGSCDGTSGACTCANGYTGAVVQIGP
jgi:hypothetical protein